MSDADRLHKVREDIKAIQADGHLDLDMVASFNSLLNLSYTPSTEINSLEQLVRYFQASLADKRKSRMQRLLFLMANWASPMVSVPRGEENRPAASGKSFYLLRDRKIENTCSIIDEESAKIQKWEESGSLAGEKPLTPALDQLKALCTKLELPSRDLMIEMFKINRDRNSLAHPDAPKQLKPSSTEADITAFKSVAEENKSEVRRLEKERVIDEETCKLYCNIIDECASYEVEKVKKAKNKTEKEGENEGEMEAQESLPRIPKRKRDNAGRGNNNSRKRHGIYQR